MVLKLALMGRMQLTLGDRPLLDLASAKARALLCFLAVDGRSRTRHYLSNLLWSELTDHDARRNLRGDLLKLRQVVEPYLEISNQALRFNSEADHWLDVTAFRSLAAPAGAAPDQLALAVDLYRGEFLEEFYVRDAPVFENWVHQQRLTLQEEVLSACQRLVVGAMETGRYETAVTYARRMINLDPVREDAHRYLMTALALNGQRGAALSHYETCRQIMLDELNAEPAAATTDLRERIRNNELEIASYEAHRPNASPLHPVTSSALHPVTSSPLHPFTLSPASPSQPFIAGPPITHPGHFFGRQRELKRLCNLVKRLPLQNGAIIGPRRSGKTSLLHYLKSISQLPPDQRRPDQAAGWLPQPGQHRWIFVDFQDPRLGGRQPLMRHLLTEMGIPIPDPCQLEDFLDAVSDHLRQPTVILLDEIGVALERYPDLDDAFWESLRSLATNQLGGNLGFIMAGPQPPSQMAQYSGYGSPFFNIFGYMATLGPFDEEEALALIHSSPIPFPEDDVAWILAESEGWPILLQILCRERLFALEEGEDGPGWREDARHQLAPFIRIKDEA
jgi:DNA-binding SARP family transcriptional activator